mmetsp:Transcript_147657/g.268332  ORF Transcript_147657/g.268332 Transcript_147657/m.268332 type:complete len:168 (-) Transcript_147657:1-504(-)
MSVFTDAYPMKYRTQFSRWFFASKGATIISWDILQIFGICHPQHVTIWSVGHVHVNCLPLTFSLSVTLLIFCYRHLDRVSRFPDRFVILKSALQTYHEELQIVETSDDNTAPRFVLRKNKKAADWTAELNDEDLHELAHDGKVDEEALVRHISRHQSSSGRGQKFYL